MFSAKRLFSFRWMGLLMLAVAMPGYAAEKWGTCTVQDVMVWNKDRLHIRCATALDGYTFFAVPWSSTEFLNQVLSVATSAIAYNKTVNVRYNPSDTTTGPTFGCAANDCRPIVAVTMNR